jgi:hypothetical protein
MVRNLFIAMVQGVLALSISMVSVSALGKATRETLQRVIPRAFVQAHTPLEPSEPADASAVLKQEPAAAVRVADIRMPGSALTYGEALQLRKGLPGETPTQYLDYLAEAARVRKYAQNLVREWQRDSSAALVRGNGHASESYQAISYSPR